MNLRVTARRLIVGTRFESPVKRLHFMLTRAKNSLYDVQTIEIMRRVLTPGSIAVDVGAFEGSMLRHMLRFAPGGGHYAFEPIPRLAERLRSRFPSCHVRAAALGAVPGVESYCEVVEAPALSGLKRRVDLPAETATREYSVQVETLDEAIPADLPIALIKIDVEGAELGVLRGGRKTIQRCRPVLVFECGLGGADSHGSYPAEVFDAITADLGLKLFLLEAWLKRQDPLSRDEFIRQFEQSLNYYFVASP